MMTTVINVIKLDEKIDVLQSEKYDSVINHHHKIYSKALRVMKISPKSSHNIEYRYFESLLKHVHHPRYNVIIQAVSPKTIKTGSSGVKECVIRGSNIPDLKI